MDWGSAADQDMRWQGLGETRDGVTMSEGLFRVVSGG